MPNGRGELQGAREVRRRIRRFFGEQGLPESVIENLASNEKFLRDYAHAQKSEIIKKLDTETGRTSYMIELHFPGTSRSTKTLDFVE